MGKFKVGDRVRIIGNTNGSSNPIRSIGRISESRTSGGYRVVVKGITDDNLVNWSTFDEIEFVGNTWLGRVILYISRVLKDIKKGI
jgi:hypothetical protein